MKLLVVVFVLMAVYGVFSNHLGAAFISAGIAVFVFAASRVFDRQDRQWLREPCSAQCPPSTEHLLAKHECECR